MRDRETKEIGSGFAEMSFTMEGEREEGEWKKTFPDPMPGSFELVCFWEDVLLPNGVGSFRKLRVRPQLKAAGPSAGSAETGRIADVATRVSELVKKSDEELDTLAGELGVKFAKKANKAQKAAAIVQKQDEADENHSEPEE